MFGRKLKKENRVLKARLRSLQEQLEEKTVAEMLHKKLVENLQKEIIEFKRELSLRIEELEEMKGMISKTPVRERDSKGRFISKRKED